MLSFWEEIEATLPPGEVTQILKMGAYYGLTPKSPEWIPFALSKSTLIETKMVQRSIEILISTIPRHQKDLLELFNQSLSRCVTTVETKFAEETQRRSEQIADAVGEKLEAVLADSRAPLVANIWLAVVTAFAGSSCTLAAIWIVYRVSAHGRLAVAMACTAVLAQWGKLFCRRFKDLVYR